MSVSNQETVFQYVGNGVTVTFPYNCQVQQANDLDVYINDAPVISGITKNGIGNLSGGSVTFSVAPASGAAVRLERVVVLERTTDYQQNGDFLARVVNPDFDRIWMALQQQESDQSRALKFPKSDINPITLLPPSASRANNLLGFDSSGNPVVVAPAAQSATALQTLLATVVGASLIGTADGRTVEDQLDMLTMQWFNASDPKFAGGMSPSRTPLQNALASQAISAAVMAAGGGIIYIPPNSLPYIMGGQIFAGATGLGYAYKMVDCFDIRNCPGSVIFEGYGATLKLAPGLKFGSFNPVTGAAAPAGSVPDNAADCGVLINTDSNQSAELRGVELDGNSGSIILGGSWGGTGYQRYAYGFRSMNNKRFTARDIYTHHHGTDGYLLGYSGATASMQMQQNLLVNVRSEYNSRQAFSWVGGVGLTAINCKFNYTGRGAFLSAPAAGMDIEAEGAVIRNGHFINCEFGGNASTGMVADSGDSADVIFEDCRFFGVYSYAVWARKPRFKFIRCLIAGGLVNTYTSPNERDRTQFIGCTISGDESFDGVAAAFDSSIADVGSQNPIFDSTTFVTNNSAVKLQNSSVNATYRNCKMFQNGSTATATPRGTFEGVNSITMTTGSADLSGTVNLGKLNISGTAAGIIVVGGEVPQATSAASFAVIGVGSNGAIYVASKLIWQNVSPTSGTYQRGDKCINNSPAVGQPKGWMCTVSGTPGTWVSEGNL